MNRILRYDFEELDELRIIEDDETNESYSLGTFMVRVMHYKISFKKRFLALKRAVVFWLLTKKTSRQRPRPWEPQEPQENLLWHLHWHPFHHRRHQGCPWELLGEAPRQL